MAALLIGPDEKLAIREALFQARGNVLPWSEAQEIAQVMGEELFLENRVAIEQIEKLRARYPSRNVMIGRYRCALAFEEQPAGLVQHLSISIIHGRIPQREVIDEIITEFAMPPERIAHCWIEEYEPDEFAINFLALIKLDS